jgi:RimJ/RimL family protein N-acetyltransferase
MEGMAIAPVLAGPRVLLRMPRVEDAEAMFTDPTSDPELTRYLSWTPHPNVAETRPASSSAPAGGFGPGPTRWNWGAAGSPSKADSRGMRCFPIRVPDRKMA